MLDCYDNLEVLDLSDTEVTVSGFASRPYTIFTWADSCWGATASVTRGRILKNFRVGTLYLVGLA